MNTTIVPGRVTLPDGTPVHARTVPDTRLPTFEVYDLTTNTYFVLHRLLTGWGTQYTQYSCTALTVETVDDQLVVSAPDRFEHHPISKMCGQTRTRLVALIQALPEAEREVAVTALARDFGFSAAL